MVQEFLMMDSAKKKSVCFTEKDTPQPTAEDKPILVGY